MKLSVTLALSIACMIAFSGQVRAQQGRDPWGTSSSGLCGAFSVGAPQCARGTTLSASAGYGLTELQGQHHRALGQLAVASVPLNWLALSLELAGRVDVHPRDELGKDVIATGDPWLRARAGRALRRDVSLGAELGVWLPGSNAPSFDARATSVELRGLWGWSRGRVQLLANAGARLDQSRHVAPDLERLRRGDRVGLGLSDAHALVWGLAVSVAPRPTWSAFAELSAQWLLGRRAPSLLASPLRAALGVRYFAREAMQLECAVAASLSRRPAIGSRDPLVPIEPRFSVVFGLRYGFYPKRNAAPPSASAAPALEPAPEPPPAVDLDGVLTGPAGAPIPDARIQLVTAAGTLETITDGEGRYSFAQLIPGKAELRADAPGFKSDAWEIQIVRPRTRVPPHALDPGASTGVLRCLVRSFESAALAAEISVRDAAGKRVAEGATDPSGALEIALPPGQYRVMIEARGYRSQRNDVQVSANEVAILNVDMRKIE